MPRSLGPYVFIRYKGKLKTAADVRSQDGTIREVAAAHLLPVIGQ